MILSIALGLAQHVEQDLRAEEGVARQAYHGIPANPLWPHWLNQAASSNLCATQQFVRLPSPQETELNPPQLERKGDVSPPRCHSGTATNLLVEANAPEELPSNFGLPRRLPAPFPRNAGDDYAPQPPELHTEKEPTLLPLEEELWLHGGAQLYEPEGDRRNLTHHDQSHAMFLRLPETWQKPEPLTAFQQFLGADPVHDRPRLHWPGLGGYAWEPRFVGYGSYELFAFAIEENNSRRDAIGHQFIVELDLRLTGTERFHVQFRPLGQQNTGGSFYQFSDPEGYVNNLYSDN